MKRILAFILMVLVCLSVVSCNLGAAVEEDSTQSEEITSIPTEESGAEDESVSKITTLAGKTPIEAYRAAEEWIVSSTNFEMHVNTSTSSTYNSSTTDYNFETVFKLSGDGLYYSYTEMGTITAQQWFTGDTLYNYTEVFKEKVPVSAEDYKKSMGTPGAGLIMPLPDAYFDGACFEQIDGAFVIALEVSIEDYLTYCGVSVSEPVKYEIFFDANAQLVRVITELKQLAMQVVNVEGRIDVSISNVGSVPAITGPEDKENYREALSADEIDLSSIDSLDKVSVSEEATDYVLMEIEGIGSILIRLFPEVAPRTVANFKQLVASKFYDGLTFHRVVKDFMIQGGSVNGTSIGSGDANTIVGEFAQNGFANNLSHKRGVLSMARSNDPDSASTQFFIIQADSTRLDGQYATFGYVVYGMDVVDTIANGETDQNDKPLNNVVISSVKFVTIAE